jgi:alkanesulfonate monooxygenase SsuD/methylene tetrahydromethanopterin reductase-like flavin-dependent oxidoreductase (luciferase family)
MELAGVTEAAGREGLFVWDHLIFTDGLPLADPWVLLTAAAAVTKRIRLGPMVTPLPRRRPWEVARQATTLDRLSNGRLILGVGLGFPPATTAYSPRWSGAGGAFLESVAQVPPGF